MKEDKKKVFIRTLGCQMNVRDTEVICGLLRKEGYQISDRPDKADVILFNTCSVRGHAEDKVWSEIGRISKERVSPSKFRTQGGQNLGKGFARPVNKIIGLLGCMAQNYKERVFERAPQVDFVVGPSDISKIPGIIKKLSQARSHKPEVSLFEYKIWETDGQVRPEEIYHSGYYQDKKHAYVIVSEGCSNYCSYCVVPYVRGELKHRNHRDILKEIEGAVARGISSITLLGQNVNAYVDKRVNFIDLIKLVNSLKGLKEFSFITSHPKDTTLELFKAMAGLGKLKKHLHLPIQSGSDKILGLMNRGYSRKFYFDLTDKYRKIIRGGRLTTDIIVGFPGEKEDDFRDTLDLVKRIEFDAAYIFKYSPRPRTKAAGMRDDVPGEEKQKRHRIILELQKKISLKNQNQRGRHG